MTVNKQHLTACLLFNMFPHMNSISSDLFQSFWGFFNVNVQSVNTMSVLLCRNSFHESLRQIGSVQNQGNQAPMGTYETMQHFNDIKEHLHTVKRNVENLVQRNAQVWIGVWTLLICFRKKKYWLNQLICIVLFRIQLTRPWSVPSCLPCLPAYPLFILQSLSWSSQSYSSATSCTSKLF